MTKDKRFIIGLDGGGTKTNCILVEKSILMSNIKSSADKEIPTDFIVGKCITGSTNSNSVGPEVAKTNLIGAISGAVKNAAENLKISEFKVWCLIEAIGLGMSGVDRPKDKKMVTSWIEEMFSGVKNTLNEEDEFKSSEIAFRIENDGVVALYSGTLGQHKQHLNKPSFILISGTGCIAISSVPYLDGEELCDKPQKVAEKWNRTAGWGPLLGDKGNGFWIGSRVLEVCVNTQDNMQTLGGSPCYSPMMLEGVKKHLNIQETSELISFAYESKNVEFAKFAQFGPICFDAAKKGDAAALKIIEESSDYLSDYIVGLMNQTAHIPEMKLQAGDELFVVLSGTVLTHDNGEGMVARAFKEKLQKKFPDYKFNYLLPRVDPACGAALFFN